MWRVFDMVCCLVSYIPSNTRNIPLMLRQLSLLRRRFYSYLLRTAEDIRASFIREAYIQHHISSGGNESNDSIPWNNLMVALDSQMIMGI
ncbi:hypothetical protein SUGI_0556480 [Cryptomeria japonica]|nr:hypothetical protein SUGI_0556480 [Cryptomeria japonica]